MEKIKMQCEICGEDVIDKYVGGVLKRLSYRYYREPDDWEMEFHNCEHDLNRENHEHNSSQDGVNRKEHKVEMDLKSPPLNLLHPGDTKLEQDEHSKGYKKAKEGLKKLRRLK